jgi:hypothetical protein
MEDKGQQKDLGAFDLHWISEIMGGITGSVGSLVFNPDWCHLGGVDDLQVVCTALTSPLNPAWG